MLDFSPTKNGIGIEISADCSDFEKLYDWIYKFDINDYTNSTEPWIQQQQRSKVLMSFAYEIRKAMQGMRIIKTTQCPILHRDKTVVGTSISYVEFIFFINVIKANMLYTPTTKKDLAHLFILEDGFENCLEQYDPLGAIKIKDLTNNILKTESPYIFFMLCTAQLNFFKLQGGKKSFRQIPKLLKIAIPYSAENQAYEKNLEIQQKKFNCDLDRLSIEDDNFDYQSIIW